MTPEEWVSDRIDELVEQLAGVAPTEMEPWLAMVVLDVVGGIHALSECGLLADGVAERALERLGPHYEESSEIVSVSVQTSLHGELRGSTHLVDDPDQPQPQRAPEPPPPTLRRVLAGGEVVGLWRGEPVTVLCVELWSDSALVNVVVQVADAESQARLVSMPHPAFDPEGRLQCDWRASDDVGTAYRVNPSSGTGTRSWWRTSYLITPVPPDDATTLLFEAVDDDRVTARAQIALS